jgi:hypothetical protein
MAEKQNGEELVSWSLVLLEERGATDVITAAFS